MLTQPRRGCGRPSTPTRRLPGWESEYEAASAAVRAASRRVEALEQLRAAQVERGGKREAAVKAAAGDLEAIEAGLSASRDKVAAAAARHLKATAELATAAAAHNALLAEGRARLASAGLQVRDPLADGGAEHAEGVLDGPGLRVAGVDWIPVPGAGLVAHGVRQVFGGESPLHPLAQVGKFTVAPLMRSSTGPDGLRVPSLADVGAVAPEAPRRAVARTAPLADVLPAREAVPAGADVSGFEPRRRGAGGRHDDEHGSEPRAPRRGCQRRFRPVRPVRRGCQRPLSARRRRLAAAGRCGCTRSGEPDGVLLRLDGRAGRPGRRGCA